MAETHEATNPVQRLYSILKDARGKPDSHRLLDVWRDVLGVSDDALRALVALKDLAAEAKSLATEATGGHEAYVGCFNAIDAALSTTNLDVRWVSVKSYLTEEVMATLRICALQAANVASEITVPQDELDEIAQEIQNLINDIASSSINRRLRQVLLDELLLMRHFVDSYRIRGARGLRQALALGIGAVVTHRSELSEADNKTFTDRLFGVLRHLYTAASTAEKVIAITEKGQAAYPQVLTAIQGLLG